MTSLDRRGRDLRRNSWRSAFGAINAAMRVPIISFLLFRQPKALLVLGLPNLRGIVEIVGCASQFAQRVLYSSWVGQAWLVTEKNCDKDKDAPDHDCNNRDSGSY